MSAKSRQAKPQPITADQPVWYQPEAPLGSAVRHVASLSPKFNWVGIYLLGNVLELGPYIGAETDHRRIPVGRGVCGTAVAENADQNIPDVSRHGNYLACSTETRSELVILVRAEDGRILGQIDIDSHAPAAFGPEEEAAVRQVARELGELWPA
jgi:L-methionine (R)-S-oxide reductase